LPILFQISMREFPLSKAVVALVRRVKVATLAKAAMIAMFVMLAILANLATHASRATNPNTIIMSATLLRFVSIKMAVYTLTLTDSRLTNTTATEYTFCASAKVGVRINLWRPRTAHRPANS